MSLATQAQLGAYALSVPCSAMLYTLIEIQEPAAEIEMKNSYKLHHSSTVLIVCAISQEMSSLFLPGTK